MLDLYYKNKTRSLFLELAVTTTEEKKKAIYTIAPEDREYEGKIIPSIIRLYLEESDPTEFKFANKYFCNWAHWQKVCRIDDFQETLKEMRDSLRVKVRAEALNKIQDIANDPSDKNYYNALRFLETCPWEKEHNQEVRKHKNKVGRPANTPSGVPEIVDVKEDLKKLIQFYDQTEPSKTN